MQIRAIKLNTIIQSLSFVFLAGLYACGDDEANMIVNDPNWTKEESIDMNAQFSLEENEEIDLFLETHQDWKMIETGTGLRYMIYFEGEGTDTAKYKDLVTVDFEISLLNGDICYSSKEKGPEEFVVEKSDIESGLHEGIKYLTIGDKAKFILPSHTAHGLIGDTEKIPPLSPVIYDIELLKIERE